jgi:hypothetical protein
MAGLAASAQIPDVSATGNCNGVAKGTNITVVVKCEPSVSKDQALVIARQYAEILNKIRRDHLSYDVVISKLDSIQKGVDELQAAARPRRLSATQIKKLSQLAGSAPSNDFHIGFLMNDPESGDYARDFQSGLSLADSGMDPTVILVPGVGLHFYTAERYVTRLSNVQARVDGDPPYCEGLREFLNSENIPYENGISREPPQQTNIHADSCSLTVGAKPPATSKP